MNVQSHVAVKFGLGQPRDSAVDVEERCRHYLAEGFVEKSAVDSKGERFLYWYKATGQPKPKTVKMVGPKTVENEVTL